MTPISTRMFQYRYVVVMLGCCTVMICVGFNRFAYTLVLPDMRRDLGLAYTEMGTISTVGFLAYMVACFPAGAVATRLGMRVAIAAGLAMASGGLFGLGLASGLQSAVLANIVVQVGSALANMAAFAIVTPWFSPRQRGIATGAVMGGAGAGIAVVGRLLPSILTAKGWRGAWVAVALVVVAVSATCAILLRNHPAVRRTPVPAHPAIGPGWAKVMRLRALWMVALVMALYGLGYITFGTFFAVRLTGAGRTLEEAGELWALVGFLMIVSGLLGGALSDRAGRLQTLGMLFAAQSLASILLALTMRGPGLYASVILYGATVMGFPAVVAAFCGDLVGAAQASTAIGFTNVFFAIGQALGPVAGGMVIDATGSVPVAFIGSAAATLLGGAGALFAAWSPRAERVSA